MVYAESPEGERHFYEHVLGEQRLVRAEKPDGTKLFFEGPEGYEHRVRVEGPDGSTIFFSGARNEEYKTSIRLWNGLVMTLQYAQRTRSTWSVSLCRVVRLIFLREVRERNT